MCHRCFPCSSPATLHHVASKLMNIQESNRTPTSRCLQSCERDGMCKQCSNKKKKKKKARITHFPQVMRCGTWFNSLLYSAAFAKCRSERFDWPCVKEVNVIFLHERTITIGENRMYAATAVNSAIKQIQLLLCLTSGFLSFAILSRCFHWTVPPPIHIHSCPRLCFSINLS